MDTRQSGFTGRTLKWATFGGGCRVILGPAPTPARISRHCAATADLRFVMHLATENSPLSSAHQMRAAHQVVAGAHLR